MTRSRHRRSEGSGEPASLPTWAQRHLDEAGTSAGTAMTTHRRRPAARGASDSPLRGWGLAVLSVAAAVTAVPLAITAVANDRSDAPLPTVDTFTAGSPQPLQGGGGGATTDRRGGEQASGDQATAGVFGGPQAVAPAAPAPAPVVVPVPLPAAVVRPTTPVVPTTITPREATPTTTAAPTTTTSDEGKSATKPTTTTKEPTTSQGDSGSGGDSGGGGGGGGQQEGLVPQVVKTAGGVVGGVGRAANGLL